jgi:hypothetical protein
MGTTARRLEGGIAAVAATRVPEDYVSSRVSQRRSHGLDREGLPRKDANQEVWKFDSALEVRLADDLKQAAIEQGRWSERREVQTVGAAERKARINRGRDRLAAEKAVALTRGEVWR